MFFIDTPKFVASEKYKLAIRGLVESLQDREVVVSIYQIGSISNPGISDIDILVVFRDGAKSNINLTLLEKKLNMYLFAHGIYGISENYFDIGKQNTFFHNYRLLWGKDLEPGRTNLSEPEVCTLKTQVALEYLVKMYINLVIQRSYRIVKTRALLLQVKALLYDLEFLGIFSGRIYELVNEIIEIRNNWFGSKMNYSVLNKWFNEFYEEFENFMKVLLKVKKIYLLGKDSYQIGGNCKIVFSESFYHTHRGLRFPPRLGWLGRKYFNIQHRLNEFRFFIPFQDSIEIRVLDERFKFFRDVKKYNSMCLIGYSPILPSLDIV